MQKNYIALLFEAETPIHYACEKGKRSIFHKELRYDPNDLYHLGEESKWEIYTAYLNTYSTTTYQDSTDPPSTTPEITSYSTYA